MPISGPGRLGKKDIFGKSFRRFGNFMTKVKRCKDFRQKERKREVRQWLIRRKILNLFHLKRKPSTSAFVQQNNNLVWKS